MGYFSGLALKKVKTDRGALSRSQARQDKTDTSSPSCPNLVTQISERFTIHRKKQRARDEAVLGAAQESILPRLLVVRISGDA